MAEKKYDCIECPAYCCSYAHIPTTDKDIRRLAKHFKVSEATARRRFTEKGDEETPRVIKHAPDEHFHSTCMFLSKETRNCTIYKARPAICRDFPTQRRCGYYEFLKFEREVQDDQEWVARTD
ncbi:MAG: YkgJ family cysteine cluster protein [Pseudomonadota bacterium]